ncbi:LysR family transcriptional regulator [Bacillus sp. T33-2]|uniref:LysR family transcriptional regulator n=1 Tax=Bacillus sp. T33-2 TaxID=2054168 RepID=UPI000C77CE1E|nr:LysR family transcriptional regulator [Bacillus sp. T33-2]PLR91600.1 hypothetical protein CVD19_21705 [Bacillus sp. T33-2]
MDISVYEVFLAVSQTQSITRAAERLYMTQPAAWMKIAALEKNLGINLFRREGKRLVLTPAGKVLHEYASRIVALHHEGIRSAKKEDALDSQFLRIGASVNIAASLLPETIKQQKRAYPKAHYLIKTGHSFQIEQMINEQIIDLAFQRYSLSLPGWQSEKVSSDPVILTASPTHHLIEEKNITLEQITHYPVIVYDPNSELWNKVSSVFNDNGLTFETFIQTDSSESVKRMMMDGLGISFLTWSSVRRDILEKKIVTAKVDGRPALFERPLFLITRNREHRPLALDFITRVKEELCRWNNAFG